MTEEELRKQIFLVLDNAVDWDFEVFYDMDKTIKEILTLIKEAGWKSPEEWNKNEIKWMNIVQGMREAK